MFTFSWKRFDLEDRISRSKSDRSVDENSDQVVYIDACLSAAKLSNHNAIWYYNRPYASSWDAPAARMATQVYHDVPVQIHVFSNGNLIRLAQSVNNALDYDMSGIPITDVQRDLLQQADQSQLEQLAQYIADKVAGIENAPEVIESSFSLTEPDVRIPVELYESSLDRRMRLTQSLWLDGNNQMSALTDWMNLIFGSIRVTATAAAAVAVGDSMRPPTLLLSFYVSANASALSDADKKWFKEAEARQRGIRQLSKRRSSVVNFKRP